VLGLPMVPARLRGWQRAPDGLAGMRDRPPSGSASMVLPGRPGQPGMARRVSWSPATRAADPRSRRSRCTRPCGSDSCSRCPPGRVLIVAARTRARQGNAEIWSADGQLERSGLIGDAVGHVLTTGSGATWAGYFDEAISGSGPQVHGLARFTSGLEPDWLYPNGELPPVDDCYALNVSGETAYCCPYTDFHLIAVAGGRGRDLGPVPVRGSSRLLTDGDRVVLASGYGPDYDLITPLRITAGGIAPDGPPGRLVLPDGLEIPGPGPAAVVRTSTSSPAPAAGTRSAWTTSPAANGHALLPRYRSSRARTEH
jgi:hypothetical protein